MDFLFNKKLHKKKKKQKTKKTREKHPGRVAQDYKFAALMKKRKEEILRNKEQSTVQSTEQSSVQPIVQSNNTYVFGVGMLAVLAIGVCLFY